MVEQREKWKHLSAKERKTRGEEKKMPYRPFESTDSGGREIEREDGRAVKKGMPLWGE